MAIGDNYVAYLRLSIALKAEKHYDSCVKSKRVELKEEFKAKLGSHLGQMYSRVGTRDWDIKALQEKLNAIINEQSAVWVDKKVLAVLNQEDPSQFCRDPQKVIDKVKEIQKSLSKKDDVLKQIHNVLDQKAKMPNADICRVIELLKNDQGFISLIK